MCSAVKRYTVSFTSVLLPEPDTPVTTVMRPTGICTFTRFKLLPRAPLISSTSCGSNGRRSEGSGISRRPDRYCPVNDAGFAQICFGVPCATTWPPCTPAPGPRSTTWSAARIASRSCSTTSTVLPRLRRLISVSSSRWLSRWCSPIDGSSRMYITPTSPEPIWLASRMRCASPPLNVSALRSSDRYPSPTSARNFSRLWISLTILSAISPRQPVSFSEPKNSSAARTLRPDLVQRLVLHEHVARRGIEPRAVARAHVCELWYFASSSRTAFDSVSV